MKAVTRILSHFQIQKKKKMENDSQDFILEMGEKQAQILILCGEFEELHSCYSPFMWLCISELLDIFESMPRPFIPITEIRTETQIIPKLLRLLKTDEINSKLFQLFSYFTETLLQMHAMLYIIITADHEVEKIPVMKVIKNLTLSISSENSSVILLVFPALVTLYSRSTGQLKQSILDFF